MYSTVITRQTTKGIYPTGHIRARRNKYTATYPSNSIQATNYRTCQVCACVDAPARGYQQSYAHSSPLRARNTPMSLFVRWIPRRPTLGNDATGTCPPSSFCSTAPASICSSWTPKSPGMPSNSSSAPRGTGARDRRGAWPGVNTRGPAAAGGSEPPGETSEAVCEAVADADEPELETETECDFGRVDLRRCFRAPFVLDKGEGGATSDAGESGECGIGCCAMNWWLYGATPAY